MYKIKDLANLSGVTTRTLRYYDKIDLLKPAKITDSGYRLYGEEETKLLQEILFLKELDFSLEEIKEILLNKEVDQLTFFTAQHQALLEKKKHLNHVITLMEKTIKEAKGELKMTDSERFKAFKEKEIQKNRSKYGKEVISKYGEESLNQSEEKFLKLSKEELLEEQVLIEEKLINLLKEEVVIPSDTAFSIYQLHQKWLSYTLDLTPEIHISLAEMYLFDERFKAYYDNKAGAEATQKLHDSIQYYSNAD